MSWAGELILNIHNWMNGIAKIKANIPAPSQTPIRIGVLGAAAINYSGIIDPIQTCPDTVLAAVSARSLDKAQAQIAKYKLNGARAYGSYEELLQDSSIDAVYIPLPNGLHTQWTLKALQAGKHVLIEKPIGNNADEVREIRAAAEKYGKVALEAYHWRFHPANHRVAQLISSGQYGKLLSISTSMELPAGIIGTDDIRLQYSLGGGSCMDLCYVFSGTLYYALTESMDTTSKAREADGNAKFTVHKANPRLKTKDKLIDEAMTTSFTVRKSNGEEIKCSTKGDLREPWLFGLIPQIWKGLNTMILELEGATIRNDAFVMPTMGHKIEIQEKGGKKHVETCYTNGPLWGNRGEKWWTTYRYQLEAFVGKIREVEGGGKYEGPWMGLDESEQLMGLIDQVYDKAGLPRRGN